MSLFCDWQYTSNIKITMNYRTIKFYCYHQYYYRWWRFLWTNLFSYFRIQSWSGLTCRKSHNDENIRPRSSFGPQIIHLIWTILRQVSGIKYLNQMSTYELVYWIVKLRRSNDSWWQWQPHTYSFHLLVLNIYFIKK